jgi:pimeloyl-ACP methyl ester carboxylesterase
MPQTIPPTGARHRLVPSPAGRTHLVEQGSGPLVLLVHGFPESWYSWRHQLPALAAAGYRAVAVDVRGYGRSSRPSDVAAYRMVELVDDVVAVVHALGESSTIVVGHDWGAGIAAHSALLQPGTVTAAALLRRRCGSRSPGSVGRRRVVAGCRACRRRRLPRRRG